MSKRNVVHIEIPAANVSSAAEFYANLFGWKMEHSGDAYVMFGIEDGMGGGFNKVDTMPPPAIWVYIGVDDIPATLAKANALGGSTAQDKTEIGGDMGYWAAIEDPCGCRLGLWSKQ